MLIFQGVFGESIEIDLWNNELEAMVLRPWSWIGSLRILLLAVGIKDSCLRLPHRTVCWKTLSDTFSLLRSHEGGHLHSYRPRRSDVLVFHVWFAIYIHMFVYIYIYYVCVYIYIIVCIWINPSPCRFRCYDSWQCLKHFAFSFCILMRTFGRLWLEDKQPLVLAGSTGSVLILKKGYWCLAKSYS